jgi:type III restriction enzyme
MTRIKKTDMNQPSLLQVNTNTAPCVPAIRDAVRLWRENGYKGATETTRKLLRHWFKTDHRLPNVRRFEYHYAQREAIETLIYLYEVVKARRQKDLVEGYAGRSDLQLLQYDDFARYCVKMATGSGKTKVMSLAIAWQYFNAVVEGLPDYARTFLILAPNVIVFERLRIDFANGRIFKTDPVIPMELSIYWDFDCYMRDDPERASSIGALYLTNIQQFHDHNGSPDDDEPAEMTAVLGAKPPSQMIEAEDFDKRIIARSGPCLVINDEAHHTHDEKLKWNEFIRDLDASIGGGIIQLDLTATPRHSRGELFTWTVYDYPLKQAIIDNIVKRPVKGLASGIAEQMSDIASVRYQSYLTAGVERWREYREQLVSFNKRPILFIMMNSTSEADDVGDYLRTKYPDDFGGENLLIIHTDKSGEVSKKELDIARDISRKVDQADSPVNCIVSVLMLREGWDVQNVTVVVGLRPYSSKANILPEQAIGRGLRLMFRDMGTAYVERLDVIGNKKFIEFVEQLEREEDIQLDAFELGKEKLVITTILPDPSKMEMDITLPVLSPILSRKKSLTEEIAGLDISSMTCPVLPRKEGDQASFQFHYEGYDIITLQKLIERNYTIPEPQTAQEVIAYYAKRIAQDLKLPSQFAALVPKVREFLETKAFGEVVELDTPQMIKAISGNVALYVTIKTFAEALRPLVVDELTPQLINAGRCLSITPPFPFSRPTIFEAEKTVFNLVACDNDFELSFARFLEKASDVRSFAKLPSQFGFAIEYTDASANLRYYESDFVVVLHDGAHYLVETKGREDIDVIHKDRAAAIWCENATLLAGTQWGYLKVKQEEFERLEPEKFGELSAMNKSLSQL